MTAYAIRYTNDIAADIARGWSGTVGGFTGMESMLEDTVMDMYILIETAELRADQRGEEFDRDEYLAELADKYGVRFDGRLWRQWHHDGLSCWSLNVEDAPATDAEAIAAAKAEGWAGEFSVGTGSATIGDVVAVAEIEAGVWLIRCDSLIAED